MKYRTLGKTKIKVSEIAFGAEWYVERPYSEVEKMVRFCEDKGINFLDCWMSEPAVRTNLGRAIKNARDKWIIQGHIGSTWQNNQYVRSRDMNEVIPAFEDLMNRFQIDSLDFGMIHYVDQIDDYNEIMNGPFMEYVRRLKEDGTIKHIGLSTHNPDIGLLAADNPEIELIMFSINPAYDIFGSMEDIEEYRKEDAYDNELSSLNPKRAELYSLCEDNEIPITVMKAYAGATLFKKETSPFGVELTPVQCIHYALQQKAVASVFVGVNNISEMEDAVNYYNASDDERDYVKVLNNAPKHSFKGQCSYCGHCSPCASQIDIAMINKFFDLAKFRDEIPESIKQHYNNLSYHASDCIACGECEDRCPFNVLIVDVMLDAQDLFGY